MRRQRRILFIAGACAVLLVVAAFAGFNARVAHHFGYALPGATGLPNRIAYADRDYSASGACWSSANLQRQGLWPFHEVA